MKLQRFLYAGGLNEGELIIESEELINQIKNVFRFEKGDKLILSDGRGLEAEAEILEIDRRKILVNVGQLNEGVNPKRPVILYLSILKKENFELASQKAVECGISKIQPIITDRTIKLNLNIDRLNKILKEAVEQSGRSDLPQIMNPVNFQDAIQKLSVQIKRNFFFDISGNNIFSELRNSPLNGEELSIWVGPEGGWTSHEIELAKKSNFTISSLGNTTLRGETAAIAASYLACQYE